MQSTTLQVTPWYRQRWPWLLMVMPGMSLILGALMIYLAITTNDGLVVDDYYNEGRAIGMTMARSEHAATLGLSAALHITPERVTVELNKNPDVAAPRELILTIIHPTQAGFDQTVRMQAGQDGQYSAAINPVRLGNWQIQIEDGERSWRLRGKLRLPDDSRSVIRP